MSTSDQTVQSTQTLQSANSPYNAIRTLLDALLPHINTAMLVRVDSVTPGGTGPVGSLSATPMVTQMDGQGRTVPVQSLPRLPYMRLQGGKCAIICDPIPGDIGIAVFAQKDISTVASGATEPSQPGSFRTHDQADGLYIGGVLNVAPETWLELTQEGGMTLHAPQKIVLDTPLVEISGRMVQTGQQGQGSSMQGGFTNMGGTVSSNGIVLDTHTHGGVQPGSGNTGGPQ